MTLVAAGCQVAPAVLHALPQGWARHPEQATRQVRLLLMILLVVVCEVAEHNQQDRHIPSSGGKACRHAEERQRSVCLSPQGWGMNRAEHD